MFYVLKLHKLKQTAFTVPQNLIKNYFNDDKILNNEANEGTACDDFNN